MGPEGEPVVPRRHAEVVGELPDGLPGFEPQADSGDSRDDHAVVGFHFDAGKRELGRQVRRSSTRARMSSLEKREPKAAVQASLVALIVSGVSLPCEERE